MAETGLDVNAFLAREPVGKLLLKFSVPCVLSMLVSALYNIVDQIFIGWSIGYLGNAATNIVFPFTLIALAVGILIRDGCAAFFSLLLGGGDHKTSHTCIGNGIVLSVIAGIILTVIGFAFTDELLILFGVTEASYGYAWDYMRIILIGIPFYVFSSGMNASIRADGSPGYAMFTMVIGAVLNLILDPVAIFILGWGVKGAAIATIIGQIASCILTIIYFIKPKAFSLRKISFKLTSALSLKICQLGISSLIIQLAIVIIMTVANNMIVIYGPLSKYGADIPLSVVGIVMKVFGICIAFIVGITVGGQPIIGYNYGAKNYRRVFMVLRRVVIVNIAIGLIATILFECFPQAIVRVFGSENDLYNEFAYLCFRVFLGGILLCTMQKTGSIFLQAIGKPIQSTLLSLSRDVIFLVPAVVIMSIRFGVIGMLWAGPIADVLAFIVTIILIGREVKVMKHMEVKGNV
ncbi:MAG: MATE family efflux transporter [Prevotella sp.]|jgi:putative MATE family efflux protein|nr:MATE family efflux transporter [Prevotella sp.]